MEETVIDELTRGRESTVRLEQFLQKMFSLETQGQKNSTLAGLIGEILGSFDRALSYLNSEGRKLGAHLDRTSENFGGRRMLKSGRKGGYRRRAHPYSCKQIKKKTIDDGYTWRKYGQKVIYNAKYPRSYYRCTYKHDKGCQATRQVQRSEDDPNMYEITYMGEHTCRDLSDSSIIINFNTIADATNNSNQLQKAEYFDEEVISKLNARGSSSENLVLQDLVAMSKIEVASCGSESNSGLQSPSCGCLDVELIDEEFGLDYLYSQLPPFQDFESIYIDLAS